MQKIDEMQKIPRHKFIENPEKYLQDISCSGKGLVIAGNYNGPLVAHLHIGITANIKSIMIFGLKRNL